MVRPRPDDSGMTDTERERAKLEGLRRVIHTSVLEKRTMTLALTGEAIVTMLSIIGLVPEDVDPKDVKVTFTVPGGGDWSYTDIDINQKDPIRVEYTTRKESGA